MPRIKLELPEHFSFHTTIPIRITDINYGGHAGNDSMLSIIHEARMQFLQQQGYDETNFAGVGLIMSDVAIEFKKELFYGDAVHIAVTATAFERVSFDILYKLNTTRNGKDITVAAAKTGMVCFDYTTKKITSVPEDARRKLLAI
ncbi:thioesterase family protein [Agriterribacter sp.]|uniref:acyl-CoA thioesterase n=1 Tax=Agriterribacter sp. TaxID=2821509 RepID=UPI002B81002C|nr:thioesterase family protein [Agriterribacter sp.]HRO45679.1 thioesterase family protein [Agriterribacter sp.]HRQ15843.1 thioesterase family protein [Agriterribacter sp.]